MATNTKEYNFFLSIIVPNLVLAIANEQKIPIETALSRLYTSKLYEALEDEKTKVWHYSVATLTSLFMDEQKNGKIIFPEEAA